MYLKQSRIVNWDQLIHLLTISPSEINRYEQTGYGNYPDMEWSFIGGDSGNPQQKLKSILLHAVYTKARKPTAETEIYTVT